MSGLNRDSGPFQAHASGSSVQISIILALKFQRKREHTRRTKI